MPADLHHIPAAFQPPGPTPEPIAMPDRQPTARALQPSESTRQRWARMARIADNSREEGRAEGQRVGYTQGWRWGLLCGVVLGELTASVGWAIWLTITAPDAAPPSAAAVPTLTIKKG